MRLAAVEQGREQPAEMGVDLLIGVEQPHPAFAVEVADRAAQPVDRLGQLLGFVRPLGPAVVELGELLLGDEVDRSDPLAFGGQPLERRGFRVRVARLVGIEAELLGQALGHAFEPLDAAMGQLGAARLLRLGARGGRGAAFAGGG